MQFNAEKWKKNKLASTRSTQESECKSECNIIYRLDAIQRNTEWHETYEKFSVGKKNKVNEKQIALEL